jgi:hypothetical protein
MDLLLFWVVLATLVTLKPQFMSSTTPPSKTKLWLKRLGIGGFLFFLIKGLIWLGVFLVVFFQKCN